MRISRDGDCYRFVDRWEVRTPIDRVYDAIGDVLAYERWWTDFVIRATGDEPPPEPGKKNEPTLAPNLSALPNDLRAWINTARRRANDLGLTPPSLEDLAQVPEAEQRIAAVPASDLVPLSGTAAASRCPAEQAARRRHGRDASAVPASVPLQL